MTTPPPPNVLIALDQPANLLVLQALGDGLGAALVQAGSGQDALRQAVDTDFAAILLDVRMPGMNGLETARLIRAEARSRDTPILFVSASDSADVSIEQACALGAVDFLTQPLVPAVIRAKVGFFIDLYRGKEELRAAERRAVNDRAFLMAVLEAIEDGIVACDAEGRLTLFNRATRELHGLPQQPLPPEQWAEHYDLFGPDGKTPLPTGKIPLFRALAGEQVRNAEMIVTPRGGTPRTLLASGQALHDETGRKLGAVVSMHDVTDSREAVAAREAALREQTWRHEAEAAGALVSASEERYRTLFDSMDEGFCVVEVIFDNQGRPVDYRYLEANPVFEKHTGLRNVVGRTLRQLLPTGDHHWIATYGAVAVSGTPVRMIEQDRGSGRWFDVYANRVGGPDSCKVAVLGNDITVRINREEELRKLAGELSEANRRKTEFLATLAHELRNPLAPIRNGLHMLQVWDGDRQALESTRDMMSRQVTHLVRLIDDLLDIARVSSGKIELKKQRVTLQSVFAGAVEASQPLLDAGRHALHIRLPEEPLPLEADPTRLVQVLGNLLNNAAKYTPDAGRIVLSAVREGGDAVIAVTDSGMGIAPVSLPHVFQMFTQVGRDADRPPGGLGIGLSLVRELVELHGGSVAAASPGVGHGSTFTVRLPLEQADAPPPDASRADGTGAAGAGEDAGSDTGGGTDADADAHDGPGGHARSGTHPGDLPAAASAPGLRVLVVDDNVDAAESLAMILDMSGHATRVACDGHRAVEIAREFRPEVVFLDIGMPGQNGYEVAALLRTMFAPRPPVLVALTGWGADSDRARSRAAGFDHHLTKPAEVEVVVGLLEELSSKSPSPA